MDYPQLKVFLNKLADLICWYILPPSIALCIFIDGGFTNSNLRAIIEALLLVVAWTSYRLWWHKYIEPF
jgi:hypothetical protein